MLQIFNLWRLGDKLSVEMRMPIETYKGFVFRLEDIIYIIFGLFFMLFGLFVAFIFYTSSSLGIYAGLFVGAVFLFADIWLVRHLIISSYKNRKNDCYYFENGSIVRENCGKEVFRIRLKDIVSVRINNKNGNRGSIIILTEKESLNYHFAYIPFFIQVPIVLYGKTKRKINLALDRKKVITEIYKANPKLNIIKTNYE